MTINEYQKAAARTINGEASVENAALGLIGETGEVADIVKKHMFQGHELDKAKLADELGDVLWYVAHMCTALGTEMEKFSITLPAFMTEPNSLERSIIELSYCVNYLAYASMYMQDEGFDDIGNSTNFNNIMQVASMAIGTFLNAADLNLSDIMQGNIDKLTERYPNGFEAERSLNR